MTTNTSVTRQTLPLSLAAPGETVKLVEIRLLDGERQRLQEMGPSSDHPFESSKAIRPSV